MKIGVLTYHRAHNHGAVLQTYALIKTIKLLGHEPFVIDYWSIDNDRPYDFFDFSFLRRTSLGFFSKTKRIITYIFCLLFKFNSKLIRYRKFQNFIIREFLVSSEPLFVSGEDIPDTCDVYIYGSDQIWRFGEHGIDLTYWGNYPITKSPKFTFAASMGSQKFPQENDMIKRYLLNFRSISVRESSLQDSIIKLGFEDAKNILDPIFLFDKVSWLRAMPGYASPPINNKRILLYYHLNPGSYNEERELLKILQNFAYLNEYNLIEINGGVSAFNFSKAYCASAGPNDFLNLISSAELVITNSFHGAAFSILFNKPFYALISSNNNLRLESLLGYFGLQDRLIGDLGSLGNGDGIDFNKVNMLTEKARQDSLAFLVRAIGQQ